MLRVGCYTWFAAGKGADVSNGDRWVVAHEGGWAVAQPDRTIISVTFAYQVDAIMHAERELRSLGGGELVLLDKNDQVRERTQVTDRRRSARRD